MTGESDARIVLGIGELLWDCFPDRRRPGGAPANVVFHATQLGHHGILGSRVGDDSDGDDLRNVLTDRGIDLACLQRDTDRPTGRVTVDISDPSAPRFEIHEDAAWDAIELDQQLADVAGRSSALCVGTLAQRSARSRETIRRCLQMAHGALTVYDVNLRPPYYRPEWIEATLALVKVVKLNDEEVEILDSLLNMRAGDGAAFSRGIIERFGVELVCVTRGAAGCLAVTRGEVHEEPGLPVQVVDTVGAGDAFTAGLITGLLRGWDVARTSRFANRLGARVAGSAGAMPELRGVLTGQLEEQGE